VGGVTTVALSHALNPSAAISAASSVEYLMMIPPVGYPKIIATDVEIVGAVRFTRKIREIHDRFRTLSHEAWFYFQPAHADGAILRSRRPITQPAAVWLATDQHCDAAVTPELRVAECPRLDLVSRHAGASINAARTLPTRRWLEPSIAIREDGFWFM
jgi:hypothetical protein